jgi:hypothetical protein
MQYQKMRHRSFSEVYHMAPVFVFILDITDAFGKIKNVWFYDWF